MRRAPYRRRIQHIVVGRSRVHLGDVEDGVAFLSKTFDHLKLDALVGDEVYPVFSEIG